jgi:hypothetical protein
VNAAGKRIPGTTTIIGRFKESGGLLHWAFKQGQSGAAQLYEERDRAGEAGTMAHDMIEASILNHPTPQFPGADDELLGKARNAFLQFLEWQSQSRLKIVETEHSYVSELYQFGGTVDAIGENAKGECVLVDWKTSNSVYQDYLVQLAAYALLLEECSDYRPKGFHLLRVAKESADFAHHYYGELEDAKQAFILMRQLYEIDAKLKKRAA